MIYNSQRRLTLLLNQFSVGASHTKGQLIYVDGGYVHLDRALANA